MAHLVYGLASSLVVTPSPSVAPTETPLNICSSNDGVFGRTSSDSDDMVVSFGYELESPRSEEEIKADILPLLEQKMVDLLLPLLFADECDSPEDGNTRQRRALLRSQARRRLEVLGISANPEDNILDDVECAELSDAANTCVVVRGEMTIYADDDQLESEATTIRQSLKTNMDDGSFDDPENDIDRVSFVDLSERTPSVNTPSGPDNDEVIVRGGDGSNDNGRLVRVVVLVGGAGLLVLVIGAVILRRRKDNEEEEISRDMSDGQLDEESHASGVESEARHLREVALQ